VGAEDSAISELWASYRSYYPDPTRPVHSALIKAYVDRLTRFLELAPRIRPAGDWLSLFPELKTLSSELKEISTYIGENPRFWPAPAGWLGQFLVEEGFTFPYARDAEKLLEKNPPGRPPSVRIRAVEALELQISQKKSWPDLAKELCPCGRGKEKHPRKCMERIRQAVLALQEVLEKYEIDIQSGL
jgi:hypothetical protein